MAETEGPAISSYEAEKINDIKRKLGILEGMTVYRHFQETLVTRSDLERLDYIRKFGSYKAFERHITTLRNLELIDAHTEEELDILAEIYFSGEKAEGESKGRDASDLDDWAVYE